MQHTQNYQLPLYEPNDVTSYLTTYNDTMTLIDTGMHQNATDIIKNTSDISTLEQQMSSANDEINELTGEVSDNTQNISGAISRLDGHDQQISKIQGDITNINEELASKTVQYYTGVLTANETTLAVEIGDFTDSTLVDVYTSVYGLAPETVTLRPASAGQPNVCVMTFTAQSADVNVTVAITNITGGN